MPGILETARSVRVFGVVLAVLGFAGFFFGYGSMLSFAEHATGQTQVFAATLPATYLDLFLFGLATGGGLTAYVLLSLVKPAQQPVLKKP